MIVTDRTTTCPKGDVPINHFNWSISSPDWKIYAKEYSLRFIKLTKEKYKYLLFSWPNKDITWPYIYTN